MQYYHWNATSVHPFLCYYQDPGGSLQHKCYVIISEHTEHDTVAVHLFKKKLIQFLTETFTHVPNKILYFQMGAQHNTKTEFFLLICATTLKILMFQLNGTFLPLLMAREQQMAWQGH